MLIKLTDKKALYDYYNEIKRDNPYWFDVDFENWCKSMFADTDCDGNNLFLEEKDTITETGIIRNFHFEEGNPNAGKMLIEKAFSYFEEKQTQKQHAFLDLY